MNDPDLDSLLRKWSAPEDVPAGFQRGVWQRIEAASAVRPFWSRWMEALWRPRPAAAAVCIALLTGAAGGFAHAEMKRAPETPPDPGSAYVQSINPFDRVHLNGHPHQP